MGLIHSIHSHIILPVSICVCPFVHGSRHKTLDTPTAHTQLSKKITHTTRSIMAKEPHRILAFALCTISFTLLSVAIYTDHWREQVQRSSFGMGNSINSAKSFEGLWNNCWWDTTGNTHCYPQPYSRRVQNNAHLTLPGRFYFYRGLCVIGLLTNFAGLLFLMSGLTCIDISTSKKIKMQIGAGMNLVAGACVLIT